MSEGTPYGYQKRPPSSAGRVIPAGTPPSRVSAPDSASSRKVSAVSKQVLESVVPTYTNGYIAPSVGVLTNLNSLPVSPSGPNGWSAWEYNAANSTYQVNTSSAVQNNTANSPVARTNVGVLTKRMLATLGAYRTADATSMEAQLCFGVPSVDIASFNETDYWRVGLVRNGSGTATLNAQYVPFTGQTEALLPGVLMPSFTWANNSAMFLYVALDGGHAAVYTNTVEDFSTATPRIRFSVPGCYFGADGEIRNTRAGVRLQRGSAANMWFFLARWESNPVPFAP